MKLQELRKVIETNLIKKLSLVDEKFNEFVLELNRKPEDNLIYAISEKDPILDELNDEEIDFIYVDDNQYIIQFKYTNNLYQRFKDIAKENGIPVKSVEYF